MAYTIHMTESAKLSGGSGNWPIYCVKDSDNTEVWWTVTTEEAQTWIDSQD